MFDRSAPVIPYENQLPAIKEDDEEYDYRREGEEKRYTWLFWAFWVGYCILHFVIFVYFGIWPVVISILGHIAAIPIMHYFIRVPEIVILQTTLRQEETTQVRILRVAAGALRDFKIVGGRPANLQMEDGSRVIIADGVNLRPVAGRKVIKVPFSAKFAWYELYARENYVREFTDALESAQAEVIGWRARFAAAVSTSTAMRVGQEWAKLKGEPEQYLIKDLKMDVFDESQSHIKSEAQLKKEHLEEARRDGPKGIKGRIRNRTNDNKQD